MAFIKILLSLLMLSGYYALSVGGHRNSTEIPDSLKEIHKRQVLLESLLSGYNKLIAPIRKEGFNVSVTQYIHQMELDESKMKERFLHNSRSMTNMQAFRKLQKGYQVKELQSDIFVTMVWTDPRLSWDEERSDLKYCFLNDARHIWIPTVTFTNAKKTHVNQFPTENVEIRISSEGTVKMSTKVFLTTYCPGKRSHWYPFDSFDCSLDMESVGWSAEMLNLQWSPKEGHSDFTLNSNIWLANFMIIGARNSKGVNELTEGSYGYLTSGVTLQRRIAAILWRYLIPTSILVCLSWLAFWIHPVANISARWILGMAALLGLYQIQMMPGVQPAITPTSATTALDIWGVLCGFTIALSLMESTLVHFLATRATESVKVTEEIVQRQTSTGPLMYAHDHTTTTTSGRALLLDKICRVAQPTLFLIIFAVFWGVNNA